MKEKTTNNNLAEWCVHALLHRRYYDSATDCITDTVIGSRTSVYMALKYSTGLGGGSTLPDIFRPYWMFSYFPSLKIELVKTVDGVIITETVSKERVLLLAEKIWNKEKQTGQLSLF